MRDTETKEGGGQTHNLATIRVVYTGTILRAEMSNGEGEEGANPPKTRNHVPLNLPQFSCVENSSR